MITKIDQWKSLAGKWIVLISTDKDNSSDHLVRGPYIWYETDDPEGKTLPATVRRAMR